MSALQLGEARAPRAALQPVQPPHERHGLQRLRLRPRVSRRLGAPEEAWGVGKEGVACAGVANGSSGGEGVATSDLVVAHPREPGSAGVVRFAAAEVAGRGREGRGGHWRKTGGRQQQQGGGRSAGASRRPWSIQLEQSNNSSNMDGA